MNTILHIWLALIDRASRRRALNVNAIHPQIKTHKCEPHGGARGKVREPSKTVDVVQAGRHCCPKGHVASMRLKIFIELSMQN